MSRVNNTTKLKENQYHYLTKDENGKRLFNNTYIAKYIGVNKSTISRELNKRKSYRFMVKTGRNLIMLLMLIIIIFLKEDYPKLNTNLDFFLKWLNLLRIKLKLINGLLM